MKRNYCFLALLLFVFSCGQTTSSPEDTVQKFYSAVFDCDYKLAKTYTTKEMWPFLDDFQTVLDNLNPDEKQERLEQVKKTSKKREKLTFEGTDDRQVCIACEKTGKECEYIELVKKDGKWLINSFQVDYEIPSGEVVQDTSFVPVESH